MNITWNIQSLCGGVSNDRPSKQSNKQKAKTKQKVKTKQKQHTQNRAKNKTSEQKQHEIKQQNTSTTETTKEQQKENKQTKQNETIARKGLGSVAFTVNLFFYLSGMFVIFQKNFWPSSLAYKEV